MNAYILVVVALAGVNQAPVQIGPFKTLFACETAAAQIENAVPRGRVRTACLGTNAKPMTWKDGRIIK